MKTYYLGAFGVSPTVAPKITAGLDGLNAGPRTVNSSLYGVSQNYNANQPRNTGHASTYGISQDMIANPNAKSEWEMDDDTRDFLTDAFNTLNQEDEFLGGGGSGGGGSGGGGGSFSGVSGSEHSTTWKFGCSRFKPQGIF